MNRFAKNSLLKVIGLGAISGLRSMSGPAFLTSSLQKDRDKLQGTPFAWLGSPITATLFTLMSAGELVVDKIPGIPPRTDPPALAARALSGALVGSGVRAAAGQSRLAGAVLGSLAAVTGAFAGYQARRFLTTEGGLPDPPVALAEDALVLATGNLLLRDE